MDLLPRSHHEFGNKDYWEKFFRKRGSKAFEWYGEFTQLCGTLMKYIRQGDNILVAGCGNSDLSANLYDVGYRNIVNVDISATVIQQMSAKHAEKRVDMKFVQMDLLEMSFSDDQFSVVLDKGTVDALFSDSSTEVVNRIDKLISEISRVLRVGGRFICISLAQQHIVEHIVRFFSDAGWMVRICRVSDTGKAATDDEFRLPVFAFVFTKFRKLPNAKLILELSYFEDKPERFETVDSLLQAVRELQQYALIHQQLKSGNRLDEQLSLDLFTASSTSVPRYTVHVVDGQRSMPAAKKFAIFIVPQGRETEWLFSSDEGRVQLHRSAGYERLLVVTLHREHNYDNLDTIKAELGEKVLELAPPNVAKQSPFLSIGDAVNLRCERYRGNSTMSGDFVIEDVDVNGQTFRRLVFLSSRNLVQSEAKLVKEVNRRKGDKGKKKSDSAVPTVDHNYVASNYYSTIIAGLAFVDDLPSTFSSGLHVTLVGLGGGGLAMYLHNNFPKLLIDVVEIDQAIVSAATNWFGFVSSSLLTVHVADGLEYIKRLQTEGSKRDVIILDVDSKDSSLGMSCPPAAFIEDGFLHSVANVLNPSGVMILNLVCRNKDQREAVVQSLKLVFGQVLSTKVPEDVNETIYCLPSTRLHEISTATNSSKSNILLTNCDSLARSVKALQDVLDEQRRKTNQTEKDTLQFASKLDKLNVL